jgi:hypothetical protein
MRNTDWVVGGVLSLFAWGAQAGVVTIDPNNYASGQIITDPTGDATLLAMSAFENSTPNGPAWTLQYSPVFATEVSTAGNCEIFGSGACAPSGDKVFGYAPPGLTVPGAPPLWGQGNNAASCFQGDCVDSRGTDGGVAMQINFSTPTDYVDVTEGLLNDADGDFLEAFNAAGESLGSCIANLPINGPESSPSGCANYQGPNGEGWPQLIISSSSDDISTLIIGGEANVRPIAKLQYDSVPAPEFDVRSTWLALTLLLSILAMLRGRRPIPAR